MRLRHSIWQKPPQNNGKDQQSVVPERADIIFRDRFADNPRLVIHLVAERSRPTRKNQYPNAITTALASLNLQFFLRFAGTLFFCPTIRVSAGQPNLIENTPNHCVNDCYYGPRTAVERRDRRQHNRPGLEQGHNIPRVN